MDFMAFLVRNFKIRENKRGCSMLCPYCGDGMDKKFVQSVRRIFWTDKKKKSQNIIYKGVVVIEKSKYSILLNIQ